MNSTFCMHFLWYSESETTGSEPSELLPMQSTASSDNQDDSNIQRVLVDFEKSCEENICTSSPKNEELEIFIESDAGSKETETCHGRCCCCQRSRCCKVFRNTKLAILLR